MIIADIYLSEDNDTIQILKTVPNVEEHYCTEKMLYICDTSGSVYYFNLDRVKEVHIYYKQEEKDNQEDNREEDIL